MANQASGGRSRETSATENALRPLSSVGASHAPLRLSLTHAFRASGSPPPDGG